MKYYYRVKYGFKPNDFASIEAGSDLEKAIYAWQTGNVVSIGNRMINGNNIISIEPHYHKYTGWFDHYEPKEGDDWKQIERDCPDFSGVLPYYQERVKYLVSHNRLNEIGTNIELPFKIENKPKLQIEEKTGGKSIKELLEDNKNQNDTKRNLPKEK